MKRLLVVLFLPLAVLAQNSAESYPHQSQADSLVTFFLGEEIFQRYVSLDTKESRYTPHSSFFKYKFRHPKFSGETFIVAFTLDSAGQFIPGEETQGLIHIPSANDSTWITKRQALNICRGRGHRIKKRSLRLEWDSTNVSYQAFRKTNDFRDIIPGDLVWKVDGEVVFRGDRYSGTFEVNVLTGNLVRRFAIPWD